MMPDLCFNEENDYSAENISDNEDFCPAILQSFQLEHEQKKSVVMTATRKKLAIYMP